MPLHVRFLAIAEMFVGFFKVIDIILKKEVLFCSWVVYEILRKY